MGNSTKSFGDLEYKTFPITNDDLQRNCCNRDTTMQFIFITFSLYAKNIHTCTLIEYKVPDYFA